MLEEIEKRKPDDARRILVRHYLPALAALRQEQGDDELHQTIDTLAARLGRGLVFEARDAAQQEQADNLFDELLAEYEVLWDCWSLQFEGSWKHPASYYLARVERIG